MPLPLIPIIIGAVTAVIGTGKTIKAAVDTKDAKDYNRWANTKIGDATNRLEMCRKASNAALEALGRKKLFVLGMDVRHFASSFEKLQNVQLEDSQGLNELNKFRLDKQSFDSLKEMGGYAASIAGGVVGGALGGGLAAFGAYSGVMVFGAASTGTAIAGLSGVAATNATLAFLGGGALSVGGLGMAGGTAVLGGLIAGPALAIMGFIIGAKASENLDKAKSNYAKAEKIEEELAAAAVLCSGIRRRAALFERFLIRLEALFIPLLFSMETTIASGRVDWGQYSDAEKKTVAEAASLAKAIKTVIDTAILTEDGKLTEESARVASEIKEVFGQNHSS
jgi:hypothetical protein